jgi:hypothetical protein
MGLLLIFLTLIGFIYIIKITDIDQYYIKNNPPIGSVFKALTKYTGADFFYSQLALQGIFGPEIQQDAIQKEIIKYQNDYNRNVLQ